MRIDDRCPSCGEHMALVRRHTYQCQECGDNVSPPKEKQESEKTDLTFPDFI